MLPHVGVVPPAGVLYPGTSGHYHSQVWATYSSETHCLFNMSASQQLLHQGTSGRCYSQVWATYTPKIHRLFNMSGIQKVLFGHPHSTGK